VISGNAVPRKAAIGRSFHRLGRLPQISVPKVLSQTGIDKAFIHSRPFDVRRWTDHPELNKCVTSLRDEVEALEGRKRERNKNAAKKFREAIRCIVLDLYVGWKSDPDLQISIAFGANHFTPTTRYDAFFLSYRPFKAAFDGLKKLGYLTIDRKG
jgi:hypothetical protein